MSRRVLVSSFYNRECIKPALDRLAGQAEVIVCEEGRTLTEDEIISYLPGVEVVIAAEEPYNARVFDHAGQLKMIARDGVGIDSVDLAEATRRGIIVNNAPVVHESVADLTMGLIIAAVRKMLRCDRGMREGRWTDRDRYLSSDVNGMTLGLLGFGRVARAVARRAWGFDMTMLTCDPYVDESIARQLGVRPVSLDELLETADILSIHTPLTDQTRGMIDAKALAKMKDGAFIINTARGAIIDESALVAVLESGKLAGAGLDVVCNEPPGSDNPLFRFDNVIFTPHVGSDTFGTFAKVFESTVTDILLFFAGKRPRNVVNGDVFNRIGDR